jgi:murein DD-endopeptidase MepM/ murein hydrolase activator NlpD
MAATLVMALAAASADARPLGTRLLRLGSHGADVRQLQKSLNRLRFPTRADGAFGPGTKTSVLSYEAARGLAQDGKVPRRQGRQIRKQGKRAPRVARGGGGEAFPVPGPHSFGSTGSIFGSPRKGHMHQGQDVSAACGSKMVSAHPGVSMLSAYQASGAGYYVVVRSSLTGEDYVYMHLARPSWAAAGTTLYAGQQIGIVGATGAASGCHLHFEMWTAPGWQVGGVPYDPLPTLLRWDATS